MNPERLQQVYDLYHAALELQPGERAQLLDQADPELRQEVDSLLAQQSGDALLDHPVAELLDWTVTQIAVGSQLGPYKIEAAIGAGGMGEVFRGLDTRLGRPVAIKVVDRQFSERFEREARAISAVNHPHICTLYDIGPGFLVMELVEGETLAARLKKGPLPVELALQYGGQIADALAAAHARGITHRDLKPGNIMVAKAGIKVLDFGLAKSAEAATVTATNVVMGTPAYMAPEQREGKECDARTDIYALGLVLYEMAAGNRAALGRLPLMENLPERLAHVIERCLAHDPEQRWQSAKDVQAELRWAGQTAAAAPPTRRTPVRRWIWGAATALILISLGLAVGITRRSISTGERAIRFNLAVPGMAVKISSLPKPAPDGSAVVYPGIDSEGQRMLWLRSLDSEQAIRLPGTEGAARPFWSPNGRWIAFYTQGKLKKVSRDGANLQTIAALGDFLSGAWGSRGEILVTLGNRTPIYRVSESGGTPRQLTTLDESRTENSHRGITFQPDGNHFFFSARCGKREFNSLYEGNLATGEIRRVTHIESNVAYVPPRDGRGALLLFAKDGKLFQQPYDATNLTGEAAPLMDVQYGAIAISGEFALSTDGRVLSIRPPFDTGTRLTWIDRSGAVAGTLGPPGIYIQPVISPDGTRILFNRPDDNGGNRDLWSIDIARGIASRLTISPANEWNQVWAPDGRHVIFASDRANSRVGSMFEKNSMDPGAGEAPVQGLPDFANPEDWSADGRWIAFSHGGTHGSIWITANSGDRKWFRFLETPFEERMPRFSPDAKWIAYYSNESGRFEVYVRPFAGGPAAASGKLQISEKGGFGAAWSRDGKELFFIGPDSKLYAAPVGALSRAGAPGSPRALFETCPGNTPTGEATQERGYDVAPDGQRFLFVCGSEAQNRYSVLVNWKPK